MTAWDVSLMKSGYDVWFHDEEEPNYTPGYYFLANGEGHVHCGCLWSKEREIFCAHASWSKSDIVVSSESESESMSESRSKRSWPMHGNAATRYAELWTTQRKLTLVGSVSYVVAEKVFLATCPAVN